jgi:hypothetical protein
MTNPWLSTAWLGVLQTDSGGLLGWRGCQTSMQSTHCRVDRGDKGVRVAQGLALLNVALISILARLVGLAVLPGKRVAFLTSSDDRGAEFPQDAPSIIRRFTIPYRSWLETRRGTGSIGSPNDLPYLFLPDRLRNVCDGRIGDLFSAHLIAPRRSTGMPLSG